jgi:hypothetical protein
MVEGMDGELTPPFVPTSFRSSHGELDVCSKYGAMMLDFERRLMHGSVVLRLPEMAGPVAYREFNEFSLSYNLLEIS